MYEFEDRGGKQGSATGLVVGLIIAALGALLQIASAGVYYLIRPGPGADVMHGVGAAMLCGPVWYLGAFLTFVSICCLVPCFFIAMRRKNIRGLLLTGGVCVGSVVFSAAMFVLLDVIYNRFYA